MTRAREDLRQGFLAATYGPVEARFRLVARRPAEAPWRGVSGSWGIVTAWNPGARHVTGPENEAHDARLLAALDRRGVSHERCRNGEGEWAEPSFLLRDVTLRDVLALGREFDQVAVVWGVGRRAALVWCDDGNVERLWAERSG